MTHSAKDRPGGHLTSVLEMKCGFVYNTPKARSVAKRISARMRRRQAKKFTEQAIKMWEEDCYIERIELEELLTLDAQWDDDLWDIEAEERWEDDPGGDDEPSDDYTVPEYEHDLYDYYDSLIDYGIGDCYYQPNYN